MGNLFGTDGVRGLANKDLTAELALDLSVAAAHVLSDVGALRSHGLSPRPLAVVGTDSRASGEFLEAAVVAGLASAGVDVVRLGVLPTPAVAYLTDVLDADLGVMLSASHNPMPDNGIKFFARGGHKLPDDVEQAIEARLNEPWDRPTGAGVGRVRDEQAAATGYVDHVLSTIHTSLEGLTVVVDGANGAASMVAPEALRRAGANVIAIHCSPNGLNINEQCGSTHLSDLIAAVREHGADLGIAHDGDADRCLAVDAEGRVVDGDQIMAILAVSLKEQGRLASDTVVATVMSNLGFKIAMAESGITMVETGVGDRYVLEAMRENGFSLGGEQSGHVVMLDHATTGDGLLTALHLLERMAMTGKSIAELASIVTPLPQVLINVRGVDRAGLAQCVEVAEQVAAVELAFAGSGRVLLRPSGTEPLIRVMVEAPTQESAQEAAERLVQAVKLHLSL